MKLKKIAFWGSTALFSLAMGASASLYLSQNPELLKGFQELGYPVYLLGFLGTAKLLGALALLFRRWATLTEWAYAGFSFNLLGAAYSHAMNGDPFGKTLMPLVFLGLLALSYGLGKSLQSASGEASATLKRRPAAVHA